MNELTNLSETSALADTVLFASLVTDAEEAANAGLLIDSLRDFGGAFRGCPVWVFYPDTLDISGSLLPARAAAVVPFAAPEPFRSFPYAYKPYAAAKAEEMAPPMVRSLVWVDYGVLILKQPSLYELWPDWDAALRPVYVRNIGSAADEPLDAYWKAIYQAAGMEGDTGHTLTTVIDGQVVRPYFNCGQYALNPERKIFRQWWECFERMVRDTEFQTGACQDEEHRVFLHQAVFSAVILKHLEWGRICHLPPEYGYPFHHQQDISNEFRLPLAKNVVIGIDYEGLPDPDRACYGEISPALPEWLKAHI